MTSELPDYLLQRRAEFRQQARAANLGEKRLIKLLGRLASRGLNPAPPEDGPEQRKVNEKLKESVHIFEPEVRDYRSVLDECGILISYDGEYPTLFFVGETKAKIALAPDINGILDPINIIGGYGFAPGFASQPASRLIKGGETSGWPIRTEFYIPQEDLGVEIYMGYNPKGYNPSVEMTLYQS